MRFSSFNSLKHHTNWPKEARRLRRWPIPEGLLLSARNQLAHSTLRGQSGFFVLLVKDLKRGKRRTVVFLGQDTQLSYPNTTTNTRREKDITKSYNKLLFYKIIIMLFLASNVCLKA